MMMVMADRTVCRHHRDNRCTLSLFAHIQSLSNESRVCDSPARLMTKNDTVDQKTVYDVDALMLIAG
jgi:hypothetical protein